MEAGVKFHFNEQTGLSSAISRTIDPFRIGWLVMIDPNMEVGMSEPDLKVMDDVEAHPMAKII